MNGTTTSSTPWLFFVYVGLLVLLFFILIVQEYRQEPCFLPRVQRVCVQKFLTLEDTTPRLYLTRNKLLALAGEIQHFAVSFYHVRCLHVDSIRIHQGFHNQILFPHEQAVYIALLFLSKGAVLTPSRHIFMEEGSLFLFNSRTDCLVEYQSDTVVRMGFRLTPFRVPPWEWRAVYRTYNQNPKRRKVKFVEYRSASE